jgi:hypothetical protein
MAGNRAVLKVTRENATENEAVKDSKINATGGCNRKLWKNQRSPGHSNGKTSEANGAE